MRRLLKRALELDVERCPHCGGEVKSIAAICFGWTCCHTRAVKSMMPKVLRDIASGAASARLAGEC